MERPECYLLSLWLGHPKTTLNAAFLWDEFLWNDTLCLIEVKGDVTLILSFLVFLSCNDMFSFSAAVEQACWTLSEYLSPETHLFSSARSLLEPQIPAGLLTLFTADFSAALISAHSDTNTQTHSVQLSSSLSHRKYNKSLNWFLKIQ